MFQSTPSGGKATGTGGGHPSNAHVSIHAFRGEGDPASGMTTRPSSSFQSTPSGGKATHPARPARPSRPVSIHAFRGEGDAGHRRSVAGSMVSIHAFRGEGDLTQKGEDRWRRSFQSTPSGGKATLPALDAGEGVRVSIHAFRGEGDRAFVQTSVRSLVSIHAFRGEGDLPQPPLSQHSIVSIHAFRGEGDLGGRLSQHSL